jgi:hypothetical protein
VCVCGLVSNLCFVSRGFVVGEWPTQFIIGT